jgi:hypothetical protein
MSRLADAANEIVSFLRSQGWPHCIVGGIAVSRWGEPRMTVDVDVCLLTGLGNEQSFVAPVLERFAARVDDAARFAEQYRVLLLTSSGGVAIDVALAWSPFEEKMLARATPWEYARGIMLPTASAEDIVVTKAFADRRQDWVDVEGILARQRGRLDWEYIHRELSALCELKEAPEILAELERMRQSIDAER